jgi:hypothetical protein
MIPSFVVKPFSKSPSISYILSLQAESELTLEKVVSAFGKRQQVQFNAIVAEFRIRHANNVMADYLPTTRRPLTHSLETVNNSDLAKVNLVSFTARTDTRSRYGGKPVETLDDRIGSIADNVLLALSKM